MVKALQCLAVLVIKSAERGIGKRGAAFGIGRPQALDPGLLAGIVAGHLAEPIELPPGALPLLVIEATELAVARNDVAAERRLGLRSEEHTSELQSLMRISYAVFCLKKKNRNKQTHKKTA